MHAIRILFAATIFGFAAQAVKADCGPLKIYTTVNLVAGPEKRQEFVPVTVAGASKQMLLDTGGAVSEIFEKSADDLKLRILDSGLAQYDVAGNYTREATFASFEMGALKTDKVGFVVSPGSFDDNPEHVGILGPDMLHKYDVHIDFGNDTLSILSQDHCDGKVIYWPATAVAVVPMEVLASGHIVISVLLDGKPVRAIVDTGAYNSTLTSPAAESDFGLKLGSPDTPQLGELAPGAKTYQHTFKTLDFEGLAVNNVRVAIIPDMTHGVMQNRPAIGTLIPDRKLNENQTDMLIGMEILRHLNIYIAYKEQKLYITPATSASTNASPPKTP